MRSGTARRIVRLVAPFALFALPAVSGCGAIVGLQDHEPFPSEAGADATPPTTRDDAGAPAPVQQQAASATRTSSLSIVLRAPPTSGNALVLTTNSSDLPSAVSSGRASWARVSKGTVHVNTTVWAVFGVEAADATITLSFAVTQALITAFVAEWRGIAEVDRTDTREGGANTMIAGPLTTTVDGALVFAVAAGHDDPVGVATDGFTALDRVSVMGKQLLHAYRVAPSAGTYTTSWPGAVNGWDTHLISFKPSLR